ncbi:MAG: DNA polymerase III subunit gamma/tau [Fimbriimonadaceae bacterium]
MAHLALYRKYRSQTFNELVGQEHVVRTLRNGLSSGRIAHAYLFTGPRGTGKTSTARLLAKCLCSEGGPTPDPDPDSEVSRAISIGACVDVLEMDAASESGVDDIRTAIVEAVEYKPMMCPFKIFIIDEVHDLSAKAFDALLKTIEEPPPHVVFILATTEYSKVPATIRSRCQKFEFHRGSLADLVDRLEFVANAEGVEVDPAALTAIARMADGGFRDALSLFEQVMLTSEGKVTLLQVQEQLGLVSDELIDSLLLATASRDIPTILSVLDTVARSGRDPRAVLDSMMYRLADLTRAIYNVDIGKLDDAAQEAGLHETAAKLGTDRLLALRGWTGEAYKDIRDISLPGLWLESRLISEATRDPNLTSHRAAAQAIAPTAKPAQPTVSPTRVAEPSRDKPAAVASEPISTPPASADGPGADPQVAAMQETWVAMVDALPPNIAARMRLHGSVVDAVQGDTVIVSLQGQMHVDWFNEKLQRIGYVTSQLNAATGREHRVELRAGKKKQASSEPMNQAVELPAEGQALHDKVVAVFRS